MSVTAKMMYHKTVDLPLLLGYRATNLMFTSPVFGQIKQRNRKQCHYYSLPAPCIDIKNLPPLTAKQPEAVRFVYICYTQ